jgi:bromodomain adjacent to zinc finger domain protein 1A
MNALSEETKDSEEGTNGNGDVTMHDGGDTSDVSTSEASSQTGSARGKQNQRGSLRERMREKQATQKRAIAERRRLDEEVNKLERRLEAIEREFRKLLGAVRIKPLGKDRFYNRIWWFDGLGSLSLVGSGGAAQYGTGRIFIQGPSEFDRDLLDNRPDIEERRKEEEGEDGILESHEWAVYSEPEEMDEFITWLNSRGNRELALKTALTKWWPHIAPGIRKRQADLQAHTKQPETNRRSSRMKNGSGHDISREPYMLWTNRRAVNSA